ncbi:hypothetical protein GCM10025771_13950 [Niveibacterium umoris]|uniref:Uncharacterized protein n=1 Tax=Niveibacterium umoris TaxID=1193620 RepID=A0A840BQ27_9RHOO|nr:hypothetical protein [Niveibacterium umoris]MBB4014733.1 hypothetical protein [Niveibacterium umoris]
MSRPHPLATHAALLALVVLANGCAQAALVELEVVDRSSNTALDTYVHRGTRFVAGTPGQRYALRLNNRSGGRVLVVLSVDGVNVVSGETAAWGQTGYVLPPWGSAEIAGWRKNMSETAAFYFAALPESYAARTGRPDNVGVIGAAVFRERYIPPPAPLAAAPAARSAEAAAGTSADRAMAKKSEQLGTGHGEREYAPTEYTEFVRASSRPDEVVQIRYDSYPNLLASGVIARPRPMPLEPQAFPGFVPDPRY